jgi:hypothetical protein
LNSGANLLGLVTIQLLPWPNQTKIESLQESGGTSRKAGEPQIASTDVVCEFLVLSVAS